MHMCRRCCSCSERVDRFSQRDQKHREAEPGAKALFKRRAGAVGIRAEGELVVVDMLDAGGVAAVKGRVEGDTRAVGRPDVGRSGRGHGAADRIREATECTGSGARELTSGPL